MKRIIHIALLTAMAFGGAFGLRAQEGEADTYFTMPVGDIHSMTCTALDEPYAYELVTTDTDPYIHWSALQEALEETRTILKFEYKCPMGAPRSEFFLSPIVAGREYFFDLPSAAEWTVFYVNLTYSITHLQWGAAGDFLRLDLGADKGITMDIRHAHFITMAEYRKEVGMEINLQQDAEGNYLVGSPEDLKELSRVVNGNIMRDMTVRQTADIDMEGIDDFAPIGAATVAELNAGGEAVINPGFAGEYDGQRHVIRNLTACNNSTYAASGVFGTVTGTVKNLGVENYTFNNGYGGRIAALCGQLVEGRILDCYVTKSTIIQPNDIVSALVAGNYGGTIQNCYGYGNNVQPYSRAGQLIGDARDDGGWRVGTEINCYCDGSVTGSYPSHMSGCEGAVSEERFRSGEIAWRLNVSTATTGSVWRQNIGEDPSPVLDASHAYVMLGKDGYISLTEDNFTGLRDEYYEAEAGYNEQVICARALNERYEALLDDLCQASTIGDFLAAYEKITSMKAVMQASAEGYAAYQKKIDEVKAYLAENPIAGTKERNRLAAYLEENVEPGDTYPNGSYPYIIENRILDGDALATETSFVQELFDQAIASGYGPGTDVTRLMVNADFTQGIIGWTLEDGTADVTAVKNAGTAHVAHSADRLRLVQTLSGLLPGIYKVTAHVAYQAGEDNGNLNQASFLFANNNKVYAHVLREGIIPVDAGSPNASHYESVKDERDEVVGYLPTNTTALAYAFGEGYYLNTISTEVGEDGELTLGISTPGCNSTNSTWAADFRLMYCGAAGTEFADAALTQTLEGQLARLSTLASGYEYSTSDYLAAPNYSAALRAQVEEAAASGPAPGDGKLAQVTALGDLMQAVYECKQAYSTMLTKAEIVMDLYSILQPTSLLGEEERKALLAAYRTASNAYDDGDYTAEEALKAAAFEGVLPTIADGVTQIATPKDIIMFSALVNSGFYRTLDAALTADLDMEGVDCFVPIGTATVAELNAGGEAVRNPGYAGTFDGQGHVIRNLTACDNSAYAASGVFGTVTGTVKNLGVENYTFNNGYGGRIAALCGQLVEGRILDCYVTKSTIIQPNDIVSALVAGNYGGTIQNCYGYGNNVQPYSRAGQLIGDARDDGGWRVGTEINCYCDGSVTGSYPSHITGCEGAVSEERFRSGEIAWRLNGDRSVTTWYQQIGEDPSPVLDASHGAVVKNDDGTYGNVTGVGEVQGSTFKVQSDEAVYDLTGRRVKKTTKGLYIVNGKKIAIH